MLSSETRGFPDSKRLDAGLQDFFNFGSIGTAGGSTYPTAPDTELRRRAGADRL